MRNMVGQWIRKYPLKDFLSGALAASCSVEWNHLGNFRRGHHVEHSCESISSLNQWFRRRCGLKKKLMDTRQTKTDHNSSQ